MPEISLTGVLVVAAVAFTVPFLLGLAQALRLPAVALEIVAGVAIGPPGFGLVEVDLPLEVLALLALTLLRTAESAGTRDRADNARQKTLRDAHVGTAFSCQQLPFKRSDCLKLPRLSVRSAVASRLVVVFLNALASCKVARFLDRAHVCPDPPVEVAGIGVPQIVSDLGCDPSEKRHRPEKRPPIFLDSGSGVGAL